MLPQHGNGRVQLALRDGIGTGQDDGGGGFDLVVVELAEVLHIHLDLARVGHSHGVAQRDLVIRHLAHGGNDVGQLAHAGWLDQNTVGMVLGNDLLQRLAKIAHQRAADAAGVHLGDVDAGILQKAAVNADLAELVLDQHQLLPLVAFGDHFFDQGRLTRAEEAGENINFCHKNTFCIKISRDYYITSCQQLQENFLPYFLFSQAKSAAPVSPGRRTLLMIRESAASALPPVPPEGRLPCGWRPWWSRFPWRCPTVGHSPLCAGSATAGSRPALFPPPAPRR